MSEQGREGAARWAAAKLHDRVARAGTAGTAPGVVAAAWACYCEMLERAVSCGQDSADGWMRWCAKGCVRLDPHGGAGAGYGWSQCEVVEAAEVP